MPPEQLVDAQTLRNTLWAEGCRPGLRTIQRWTESRIIPSWQVGRLRYYYLSEVKEQLAKRNKIKAR